MFVSGLIHEALVQLTDTLRFFVNDGFSGIVDQRLNSLSFHYKIGGLTKTAMQPIIYVHSQVFTLLCKGFKL